MPMLAQGTPLYVTTYNVADLFFVSDAKTRGQHLGNVLDQTIQSLEAKNEYFVFFLQEVFSQALQQQLKQLSRKHHVFLADHRTHEGIAHHHGLVILTNLIDPRHPSMKVEESFVPWDQDSFQIWNYHKGMLTLCLQTDLQEKEYCFVNVHMTYTSQPYDGVDATHQLQLEQLLEYISKQTSTTIVAGDFNLGHLQWWVDMDRMPGEVIEIENGKGLWTAPAIDHFWDQYVEALAALHFQLAPNSNAICSYDQQNPLVGQTEGFVGFFVDLWTQNRDVPYHGIIDHIFYKVDGPSSLMDFCHHLDDFLYAESSGPTAQHAQVISDHYAVSAVFDVQL